ncbi:MAG: phosphoribosylformylglycinamidine cyclo-ligase [Desulfofustis sp.]|nr:phosphoribosylformylglycinamidine cyclo-ligase [Desulfofustis sp.]MBT8355537.1 phosphoribosylformylglycinamidine cyclo-ligase [Desulfofustis sp.]
MTESIRSKYQEAGVDIDKGNAFVRKIKNVIADTHQRGVISEIGGFSSLFSIDKDKYESPVLVSSTDGVGTKLAVAKSCGKHDTIGIDLVAMCANDIIVSGAKPLFFLDYLAVGKLELEVASQIVTGIAEGCKMANCSLVGGETAEMPGLYKEGDYDIAGFVTGIVDRDNIIDGSDIRVGNKIIGLESNGLHANGFSLVRKICFNDLGLSVDDYIEELGLQLGEELLKPTRIYVQPILNVLKNYKINGMVHNTGGGFYDNIPRVLPNGCRAIIDKNSFPVAPVFPYLASNGGVPEIEMYRTFNMGIGFMAIVEDKDVNDIMLQFTALGETPYLVGEVQAEAEEKTRVEFI